MAIIVVLICVSIVVASLFLCAFIWSVKSGQYDDTYTPSVRMLFEDQQTGSTMKTTPKQNHK